MGKIPVRDGWLAERVAFQPASGQLRLLVDVRREACPECASGVLTATVWSTRRGTAEEIAWCGSCFNASTRRVRLRAELRQRAQQAAVPTPEALQPRWTAVRPALEDLEQRGLL